MKKMKKRFKRNKIVIFIGFIGLLTIVAPFIFTRKEFLGIVFDGNTAPIGDTIGGITAPFLGFLSIILLYITLKRQVDFNDKQDRFNEQQVDFNNKQIEINHEQLNLIKKQDARDSLNSDFTLIFNLQKQIDELFENITTDGENGGMKALISLTKDRKDIGLHDLMVLHGELAIITMSLIDLLDNIYNSSIPENNKKIFFTHAENRLFRIEQFVENIKNKNIKVVNNDTRINDFNTNLKRQIQLMEDVLKAINETKERYEDF